MLNSGQGFQLFQSFAHERHTLSKTSLFYQGT